jgi:hypothetical protein
MPSTIVPANAHGLSSPSLLGAIALDAPLPQHDVGIRGPTEPIIVCPVTDAKALSSLVNDVEIAAA